MAAKDKTSPATTSLAYDAMLPKWVKIETLLAGTEAMRAAGQQLTPKHESETDDRYQERIGKTVLLEAAADTLTRLAAKPFSEPVKIGDDVPVEIAGLEGDEGKRAGGLFYDVDLQGNNLDVFCHRWFREGLAKSFAHVLVDMPRVESDTSPDPDRKRTLDDDRRDGMRPYWTLIKPENIIAAHSTIIDGVEKLTHIRIFECFSVQDGFAEVQKERIRVLEPGRVELWEPHPTKKKDGLPVWEKVDDWETDIDVVPLVTFYAHREGLMLGKPPLMGLVELNITHWNSASDQRNILTVSRFPILACSGASEEESTPIKVGPYQVLYNENPQGKFYYVEHTGASIEAGRNDLEDLKAEMGEYGQQFLAKKPGNETATGRAIDSAEETTDLAAWAGLFEDAVAQALSFTAMWLKMGDQGGSIQVLKDFNRAIADAEGWTAISDARGKKDLSRETFLQAMVDRGYLPPDFNIKAENDRITTERDEEMAAGFAGMDLDPLGNKIPGKPNPTVDPEDE